MTSEVEQDTASEALSESPTLEQSPEAAPSEETPTQASTGEHGANDAAVPDTTELHGATPWYELLGERPSNEPSLDASAHRIDGDPTRPLERVAVDERDFSFVTGLARDYQRTLRDKGVLLIVASHEPIGSAAAIAAANAEEQRGRQARCWDIDTSNVGNLSAYLNQQAKFGLLGSATTTGVGGGHDMLLVVRIRDDACIDELFRVAPEGWWVEHNVGVIFLVAGSATTYARPLVERFHGCCWIIDCVSGLLAEAGCDSTELDETQSLLRNAWGGGAADHEVCRRLERFIRTNGRYPGELDLGARADAGSASQAIALLRDANAVDRAVLFVAAYLPDFAAEDATELIDALVDGSSVQQGPIGVRVNRVPALEHWQDKEEHILNSLGLAYVGRPPRLQFVEPEMEVAVRESLGVRYTLRAFETLFDLPTLLSPSMRSSSVHSLSSMCAQLMVRFPQRLDSGWAFAQVASLDLGQSLQIDRLSSWFRAMLRHQETAQVVDAVLKRLATHKTHAHLSVNLLSRLGFAQQFDALQHYRHVFDVASRGLCEGAALSMCSHFIADNPEALSVLETISSWFPPEDQDAPLSGSQRWGLALPLVASAARELLTNVAQGDDTRRYDRQRWAVAPVTEEHLSLLVNWLSHKRFLEAVTWVLEHGNRAFVSRFNAGLPQGSMCHFALVDLLATWLEDFPDLAVELVAKLAKRLGKSERDDLAALASWMSRGPIASELPPDELERVRQRLRSREKLKRILHDNR
ncbi:MAG: hypothetical protein AAGA68_20285 [Pseudomonadota bacterium]